MTDALLKYDELVQRHDAAYAAFKSIYVSKNPAPTLEKTGIDWLSVVILGVLVVASITVSGSRTIDEFGGGLVGVAAFVMLEIALIAYAYWRTKKADDVDQQRAVRKRANVGMWLAFGVSLAANLHATLKHAGIVMPAALDTGILILIAISAPSLALIAGDMLGMEAVAGLALKRQAGAAYHEALRIWSEGLNKSWDSQKSRWGVRVEVEPFASHSPRSLNSPANEQPIAVHSDQRSLNSANGYSKNMDARAVVSEWLLASRDSRPELMAMKVDELHALALQETGVKIGRTSVHNARKALLDDAERTEV